MKTFFLALSLFLIAAVCRAGVETSSLKPGEQVIVELQSGRILIGRFASADAMSIVIDTAPEGGNLALLKIAVSDISAVRPVASAELAPAPSAPLPASRLAREAAPATTEKPKPELTDRERELLALVDEFPPGPDWSDERYVEIARRDLILDLRPTRRELRFREVYPDWIEGKSLAVRLARGETPGAWQKTLDPGAAWTRFSDNKVWPESLYQPLLRRLFYEDFDDWTKGKALAAEVAVDPSRKLSDDEEKSLSTYRFFPSEGGWTEALRERLKTELADTPKLIPDERLFVRAFPDYLEGKSQAARAEAARRAPSISYDEVKPLENPQDLPSENISTGATE
ncbi:MAG: hypothetical protein V2A58_05030 [Planctomycetota bacterium]